MNHGNHSTLNNPLWKFSWDFYAQPQVAPACLALQNQYDVNVNLVCWLIWSTLLGKRCSQTDLQQCVQVVGPLNHLTIMLRNIRIQLKAEITEKSAQPNAQKTKHLLEKTASLRSSVKELELLTEQYQQRLLFEQTERHHQKEKPCDRNDITQNNLKQLLHFYQMPATLLKTLLELLEIGEQIYARKT